MCYIVVENKHATHICIYNFRVHNKYKLVSKLHSSSILKTFHISKHTIQSIHSRCTYITSNIMRFTLYVTYFEFILFCRYQSMNVKSSYLSKFNQLETVIFR